MTYNGQKEGNGKNSDNGKVDEFGVSPMQERRH